MPALKNLKHEAFAQAVAEGMSGTAAYRANIAEPGTLTTTCMVEASKLLANPNVSQRVAELRKSFQDVLEKQLGVRRETMARKLLEIIETPTEEIANTPNSPLAQKIKRKRIFKGSGEDAEEWEMEEVEASSRMDAIKEINKMAGWYSPEEVKHSGSIGLEVLSEAVAKVFGK